MAAIGGFIWDVCGQTLIWLIASAAGGLVQRFLIALGIGTVTAIGFHALLSSALSAMSVQFSLNPEVMGIVQACGLPWLAATVVSGITTRLTIKGLLSDSMTFWVKRMQLPGA